MTKLPKIEVWNIDPQLLHAYQRWVMTSDRVVVKVSPSWHRNDQLTADHVLGMTVDMLRLIYTVERDDRISDS